MFMNINMYKIKCLKHIHKIIEAKNPCSRTLYCLPNRRYFCSSAIKSKRRLVLGIESSCDDTGAAVVDERGNILGEGFHSQLSLVLKLGGVIGPHAGREHATYIQSVVKQALDQANVKPSDLSAIAATNKPGFKLSLQVGCGYGQKIALHYNKPFIPIHHMQAHALTVRMIHKVDFPYLVLLVSGGHCLLVLCNSLDEWHVIGESRDIAPGNALDKIARRLKLKNLPLTANMSGGRAIETIAKNGIKDKNVYSSPLSQSKDCDFSFSGIVAHAFKNIIRLEQEQDIIGGTVLSEAADVASTFQAALVKHICNRTQRALIYCQKKKYLPPENSCLVVSGGVACNQLLSSELKYLCDELGYKFYCPPPKLCTDNGVMIAWNGMERLMANSGVISEPELIKGVTVFSKAPIGPSLRSNVSQTDIRLTSKWINK